MRWDEHNQCRLTFTPGDDRSETWAETFHILITSQTLVSAKDKVTSVRGGCAVQGVTRGVNRSAKCSVPADVTWSASPASTSVLTTSVRTPLSRCSLASRALTVLVSRSARTK